MPARRWSLLLSLAMLAACTDTTAPPTAAVPSLTGTWTMVSMSDAGTPGSVTGTATFRADSTYSVRGTVTFLGQSAQSLLADGTWAQQGSVLTLTSGSSVIYDISVLEPDIVLSSRPPFSTVVTLARPAAGAPLR